MKLSSKDYKNFTKALKKINDSAGNAMEQYIAANGIDDVDSLVRYGYGVSSVYGNASASLAAAMYDEIVSLENKVFPAAELADNPEFGEVAQAIQGTLKQSVNAREVSGAVSRLVKRTGQDTLIKNGMRDGAEFAWVPIGDTCPLCKTIASRGWQPISKKALKKGHAEHIHANCDCSYMIRHDSNFNVAGYDPEKYLEEYENAEGKTSAEKINSMRRMQYAERKDVINAQKRAAYAERKNKGLILDVTSEYKKNATPGVGRILFDKGYDKETHKDEVIFSEWLYNTLGGKIQLLNESNIDGQKMPDFIWNDKSLELKSVSSIKSVDRQIHRAIKQINDNGIIAIDISGNTEGKLETIKEIEYRFPKRARGKNDLLIKDENQLLKVIRNNK